MLLVSASLMAWSSFPSPRTGELAHLNRSSLPLRWQRLTLRALPVLASALAHASVLAMVWRGAQRVGDAAAAPVAPELPVTVELAPESPGSRDEPAPLLNASVPNTPLERARRTSPSRHAASGRTDSAANSTPPTSAPSLPPAAPPPVRFVMAGLAPAVGTNPPANAHAGTAPAAIAQSRTSSDVPARAEEVDTSARLIHGAPPAYTAAAEAAGIEATLRVELVIDSNGFVGSAIALEHVGYGLDEVALAAVRNYRFVPAKKGGRSVAVRMRWVIRFELR